MGLELYNKKRSFDKTPEPTGHTKAASKELLFVIQKHAASHLHYDFRLELHGVLKSWAVPKGPSMNPADKRLAMMVEDHPFDYKDFEGIIPKGNYGAGTVIIWDQGTYEVTGFKSKDKKAHEKELSSALHKGNLRITMKGKKLKGEFVLVKSSDRNHENAWLLMKKSDQYATTTDITQKHKSVVSGKTIEQIAKTSKTVWNSNRDASGKLKEESEVNVETANDTTELIKAGRKAAMPEAIKPMLASLSKNIFDDPDWIYEVKWDGYRALAYCKGKKVDLRSRNNLSYSKKFYPLHDALASLELNVVLDGEIIVANEQGGADFQKLQAWQKDEEGDLVYYAFDVLWVNGYDVTALSLLERKQILKSIIPEDQTALRYSDHIEERGKDFYKIAVSQGLEGIMAKQAHSQYHIGKRAAEWLKIKTHQTQEAVICGYTAGKNSRQFFGSLILGLYEGKQLVYIGQAGSGFDEKKLAEVHSKLKKLETDKCPFKIKPKTNTKAVWVEPKLVCEVKFQEWTKDNLLRIPIFLGMREDKDPLDVKKEIASEIDPDEIDKKVEKQQTASTGQRKNKEKNSTSLQPWLHEAKEQLVVINKRELKLTNLDKIYWPDEKITKRQMLDYYHAVAEYIIPYIKDRPQSLNRHPDGIKGESFYQKNVKDKVPDWIATYDYKSDDGKDKEFLVAKDEASLIYIANLGCIEINPWHSRISAPENPDWCVIDLDPDTNDFEEVITAAQVVKQVLDSINVPGYCKTSGSTGLHIYIPLGAKYDYEQSKQLAELIVTLVHDEIPDFTSIVRATKNRKGKIYLDFLQNRSIQTIAAPYSLRPKPGATVSTPLHWEEVKPGLKLSSFTIFNILDRIKNEGDIFKAVMGKGIDMKTTLENMSRLL
jgi:bifunctional non-homologous end joining protein LigD